MRRNLFIYPLLIIALAVSNGSAQTEQKQYPPAPTELMETPLTDVDGTAFKLSDLYGKVILVNLWSEWCAPCRQQMSELIKMQREYYSRGFEVIGINAGDNDGKSESVRKIKVFADRLGVNYNLAQGTSPIVAPFYKITKAEALPGTILIGRDGTIRGHWVGSGPGLAMEQQIRLAVEKALSEPQPVQYSIIDGTSKPAS